MFASHRQGFKILKRFHYLDHSLGPLLILSGILNGLIPFIPILFSRVIIARCMEGQYTAAMIYGVIMSGLFCVLGILSKWLTKVVKDRATAFSEKISNMIHQKPLLVDYQSVEDGRVIADFNTAIQALKYKGDYSRFVSMYALLVQNSISFLLAIGLTVELCMTLSKTPSGILYVFTHPVTNILILVTIILGMLLVTGKAVKWIQGKINCLFNEKLDSEQKFSYLIRMFRDDDMVKTIQAYNAEEPIDAMLKSTSTSIRNHYRKECDYAIIEQVVKGSSSGIITLVSYVMVALKILSGAIGIDAFVKYSQAIIKMNDALLQIIVYNHEIKDMMTYMEPLMTFIDMDNKFHTGSIPVEKRSDHEYKICFEDVWFKYPGTETYVIKGISCEITSNLKSALVGPNGAGKSTLIKLLCRLYEPTRGKITLNGIDIKKYDYKEYQALFSIVFQDFGLLSFGIGENIATDVAYDKASVSQALTKVGLGSYRDRLDHSLGEPESNVKNKVDSHEKYSGGEQQKIAIARALYKDAPFVILDEPTAALDPLSEFDIYQNFNDLIGEKTCLYISHRMSSCRFCKDILVLDQGQLVERGCHEALLDKKMLYNDMWHAQAKYYKVG